MVGMMMAKNASFPSRMAWNSHLEGLYHLPISGQVAAFQETLEVRFRLNLIPPEAIHDAAYLPLALAAFKTALTQPLFDAASLRQEKDFLKDEWTTKKASKSYKAVRHLTESILQDHPYFVSQIEDDAVLEAVPVSAIEAVYETLLSAPRVLVRVGPLKRSLGADILAQLPRPKGPIQFADLVKKTYAEVPLAPVEDAMKQTMMFDLYATGIWRFDDDYDLLVILNQLLGGDSESLLFKTIREEHHMAYSVSSTVLYQYGLLLIQGGISPANKTVYLKDVHALIDQLIAGTFKDAALDLAKQSHIEQIKRNHDAKGALESRAFYHVYFQKPFDKTALIKRLDAINKADIQRVAAKLKKVTSLQYGAIQ